ncbi:unnamed protein product [Choristocarpus tenellus]
MITCCRRPLLNRILDFRSTTRQNVPGKKRMTSAGPSVNDLPPPPEGHSLLVEGQAAIPFSEGNEVFYNKVQVFNRDLSIHVIKLFAEKRLKEKAEKALRKETKAQGIEVPATKLQALESTNWTEVASQTASKDGIRILDALAATALRSIRYVKEIPGVKQVLVNDLDEAAVEAAQRNMTYNQVDPSKVKVQQGDATMVMYSSREPADRFDVIDLDPYGSAAPFIDAALQSVADGGLLCVTCTDMAVLGGGHPETCYARYGSMPTRGKYLHEMALRMVLHSLESQANRYKRHIVPILSLSIDFYVRLFVRVYTSPSEVKKGCTKACYVYQSLSCGSFFLQSVGKQSSNNNYNPTLATGSGVCPQTGARLKVGGPIWGPPIHDMDWVQALLERVDSYQGPFPLSTRVRIHGMLTSVSEELPDVPLFYSLPDLCSTLHCNSPRLSDVQAAIVNAGYRVSQQHKEPQAIKTDAPDDVMWDIMRCWVKKHPINDRRASKNSPGQTILAREPEHEVDFTIPPDLVKKKQATRYQSNPEANWGPKSRATGKKRDITIEAQKEETADSAGAEATSKKPRLESECE